MKNFTTQLNKNFSVLSIEHPLESVVTRYLGVLFCLCLLGYLYFVSASVLNVIAQREADQTSQKIEGDIGSLEQQYFALAHDVTPDNATEIGLVPITNTAYVYRPGSVGVATVSSNAI